MLSRAALALTTALLFAAPALAQTSALAPADEYFGHYRVSVLGITNLIRDAGARVHDSGPTPDMMSGPLAFAADAIHDWESKYPADTWIPRELYNLQAVYASIGTPDAMRAARKTVGWLAHDYPNSHYANDAVASLGDPNDSTVSSNPSTTPWERSRACARRSRFRTKRTRRLALGERSRRRRDGKPPRRQTHRYERLADDPVPQS